MPSELAPCPFCGSAHLSQRDTYVECSACEALGPDPHYSDEKTAIAAWNARTPSRAAIRAECLREVAEEWDSSGHPAYAARLRVLAEKEERDG